MPFVAIRPENDASRSLYTKLGFNNAFQTARVIMRPKEKLNGNSKTTTADDNNIDEGIEDSRDETDVLNNHSNGGTGGVNDEGVDIVEIDKED